MRYSICKMYMAGDELYNGRDGSLYKIEVKIVHNIM